MNVISFMEKDLNGAWDNKLQKLQVSQNEILRMMIFPVYPQFLWNLNFIFLGSHQAIW